MNKVEEEVTDRSWQELHFSGEHQGGLPHLRTNRGEPESAATHARGQVTNNCTSQKSQKAEQNILENINMKRKGDSKSRLYTRNVEILLCDWLNNRTSGDLSTMSD